VRTLCEQEGIGDCPWKTFEVSGEEVVSADTLWTRGVLQMRTSVLFWCKKFGFFEIMMCPHGQAASGGWASADILWTRGRLLRTVPNELYNLFGSVHILPRSYLCN